VEKDAVLNVFGKRTEKVLKCPAECGIFGENTTHVVLKKRQLHFKEL